MTIGERIAKCRKDKNLSQEYIAELLGVSRQAVSKWETNQTEPDTGNLIKLARVFGVSVEYLASGEVETPRVVYVEKNLPLFKIIGIVITSLGALSLLLGALMPVMLGIGIVTVAFGILLMLLKKDGLILSGIILAIGVALFLIQGIFFGIDTPIMCLIAAISVGVPILIYSIIKLIKKIKAEGMIGKLKDNPKLIKRIILVTVIAAIVVSGVAVSASIANQRRRNVIEKAMFFSSERLTELDLRLEGLPAPNNAYCLNLNNEKLLLNFEGESSIEYLESLYKFLEKRFNYLGTRGEVIFAEGEAKIYEFVPHDKHKYYGKYNHSGFNSSKAPDDYYFVFSNSIKNEVNGEIDCCVIHINLVGYSEAIANGKTFVYNAEMSIYRESVSEGYKFPTYTIEYAENVWGDDLADYILPDQPAFSLPDKEVTVRIKPQNEGFELWIDGGKQIQRTAVTDEYWEYTFTMPEHNIKLVIGQNDYKIHVKGGSTAETPRFFISPKDI